MKELLLGIMLWITVAFIGGGIYILSDDVENKNSNYPSNYTYIDNSNTKETK